MINDIGDQHSGVENLDTRVGMSSAGLPWMVILPAGLVVLIAASLFYSQRPRSDLQWLGMEIEPLVPQTSTALGLSANQQGVFVSDVVGVAAAAGVMEGDVIVAVDGQPTADVQAMRTAIHAVQGHPTLRLDVIRQGAITAIIIGAISPHTAPASVGGTMPAAVVPPASAGDAMPAAWMPPACATCPTRAGCLPGAASTPAAFAPWTATGPLIPAAYPGGGQGCPLR